MSISRRSEELGLSETPSWRILQKEKSQQDGCSSHFANNLITDRLLDWLSYFKCEIICIRKSCDFTPLNFFFRGT